MKDEDWVALQVAQRAFVDRRRRQESRRARLRRMLFRRIKSSRRRADRQAALKT